MVKGEENQDAESGSQGRKVLQEGGELTTEFINYEVPRALGRSHFATGAV